MGAREGIVAVQAREVGGRMRRDKVCLQRRRLAVQRPAHNLLDLPRVEVDAGPEACHFRRRWAMRLEFSETPMLTPL